MNFIFFVSISFVLANSLTRRARNGILYLDEFEEKARKIARNYLSPAIATATKCNKFLELDPNGPVTCYAISAGDPTKPIIDAKYNPGNIAKQYYQSNISVMSSIYYGEPNKFVASSLGKQGYDYVIVTTDKNPSCEIVQFKSMELEETHQGPGSIKITKTTASRMTKGFSVGASLEYTTPFGDYLPSFSIAATYDHANSIATISQMSIGQTFNSVNGGSCTPYAMTFGIKCEQANYLKVFGIDGKFKRKFSSFETPKPFPQLMPVNGDDPELFAMTVGCVELNTKGRKQSK